MSLASQVDALASRVAVEFKSVRAALTAALQPEGYDSFVGKADGALNGRTTDSGATWIGTGAYAPTLSGGALGYPGNTAPNPAGAWYGQILLPSAMTRLAAKFRWNASNAATGSVAMGAFTTSGPNNATQASAHLSIGPYGFQFSVLDTNLTFIYLTPDGHPDNFPRFPRPMLTDGVTEYEADVLIDRANSRAYVTIGDYPTVTYSHPLIGSVDARYFFIEGFTTTTTDNVAQFTEARWSAASAPTGARVHSTAVATARAAARAKYGGAGTIYQRPSSRMLPGATYYDRTANSPTWSDGEFWRNSAGVIAGNMVPLATAKPTEGVAFVAGNGCTVARVRTPTPGLDHAAVYQLTATATGTMGIYNTTFVPVTGGQTYSGLVGWARSATTARNVYCVVNWYDAASASLGSSTGATVSAPTTGWASTPVITAAAPASATKAIVQFLVTGVAAVGEVFYGTGLCLVPGTVTGYVEV